MQKINIAICDDLEIDAEKTEETIKSMFMHPQLMNIPFSVTHFRSGQDLLASKEKHDILFLDVQMPEMDGFEVGKALKLKWEKPIIIYLTSHEGRASEAFPAGGFRYLSKEIDKSLFLEALSVAVSETLKDRKIKVKHRNENGDLSETFVKLSYITNVEAMGRASILYTQEKVFMTLKSLKKWESELRSDHFFRVSKSQIVHFLHVKNINEKKRLVYLDSQISNNMEIEVSRSKAKEAFEAMHAFFRGVK